MRAFGERVRRSESSVTKQGFCRRRLMIRLRFRFPRMSRIREYSSLSSSLTKC